MRKMITLTCKYCDKEFQRKQSSHNYMLKKGWNGPFCSRSCRSLFTLPSQYKKPVQGKRMIPPLFKPDNKISKYTIILYVFKTARTRAKQLNREFSITLDDAFEIFERQGGQCVYSGLELDGSYKFQKAGNDRHRTASIDRIDSTKGYTKDNIQFVSVIANLAKNRYTHEEMVEFCKALAKKWN